MGVYSRELLWELAAQRPEIDWNWLYRPHRFLRGLGGTVPKGVHRGLLFEKSPARAASLFHGLNQRLPRKRFPRQVATFHDLFVMTAEYSTAEFRARFTAQARHAAAEADRVIAVSHFTANQVADLLGVEPARITAIPHGVRSPRLPDVPREKIILHVGAIQRRKNLVRLVRAFRAAPRDWRLVLAGSAGFGAEETYEAIAESRARDRIIVTGYVGADELAELYARARIFAFPSLDEGFGMPVLEAMASGIPVIASNGSAVAEAAGNAAVLVNPRSEEELAGALELLAGSPEICERMIAPGILHASHFTWGSSAAQTLAVYEQLR